MKAYHTTSVLAAAVLMVDVGDHHPVEAEVAEMRPRTGGAGTEPANPATSDKSPTSIRHLFYSILIIRLAPRMPPFTTHPR